MVFSSLVFLYLFLPLCILTVRFSRTVRVQNYWLLAFSLFFYAWGEPVRILQMLASGSLVFLLGLGIDAYRARPKIQKLFLTAALLCALFPLLLFKYAGFFLGNIKALTGANILVPQFALPLGISFYTFQIMTYAIDLYRGDCQVQRSLSQFFLYESFFPQLIAGPIVRYAEIAEQLAERQQTWLDMSLAIRRFSLGLAKKVLLANYAGKIVAQCLEAGPLQEIVGLQAWLGLLAYSFQIYFDFSAYSDMAIGLGRFFGFRFPENFNYPYVAASVTEFWRRWHMSLGRFFRDYVYIPLGGGRKRQLLNLSIVWFLTGFWHGASWNFIFWGLYFLGFLILEKRFLLQVLDRLPAFFRHLYLLLVVFFGWGLFRYTDLSELGQFFSLLFTGGKRGFMSFEAGIILRQNLLFFLLAGFASLPWIPRFQARYKRLASLRFQASNWALALNFLVILLSLGFSTAALVADSFNPFLYFRF